MITGRHHIYAKAKQLLRYLGCDAKSSGGILYIGDRIIDAMLRLDSREVFPKNSSSTTPNNVTNEENFQCKTNPSP
jgi:hypothetical protein